MTSSVHRDPAPLRPRALDDTAQLSRWIGAHGRALAARATSGGLAVTRADGTRTPIAVSATPVIVDDALLRERARTAALLSSASVRMARLALSRDALRPLVLGALSPLEAELAQATTPDVLATTRVDFFAASDAPSGADALRALEVNATIPAMQGYSDIAARAFFETLGEALGARPDVVDGWRARNGSNADALWRALVAGFSRVRPGQDPRRVALLCRREDAQLTEVEHLRASFARHGVDALVVHPDQLTLTEQDVRVDGRAVDLIYRHLFVRRLEEPGMQGAAQVLSLLRDRNGARAVLLNPPASQVETKSVFALLSLSTEDERLAQDAGLTPEEREAVARSVPWTRVLRPGAVADAVAARPDAFVLKRVWDYGGRAVLIGRERDGAAFLERVRAAWPTLGAAASDWAAVVARAAEDERGGGFVVQELVDVLKQEHTLCTPDTVVNADVFVDFSMFASVGLAADVDWGGVCRTSTSSIVNIMGGGGLAPILKASVAREIVAHAAPRGPTSR